MSQFTALVVDDQRVVQSVCRRVLETMGFRTLGAGSCAEALDLIDKTPDIDLLLTDVVIPDGSAEDIARQFRKRFPRGQVLCVSGTVADCAESDIFLGKPFMIQDLRDAVRQLLPELEAAENKGS